MRQLQAGQFPGQRAMRPALYSVKLLLAIFFWPVAVCGLTTVLACRFLQLKRTLITTRLVRRRYGAMCDWQISRGIFPCYTTDQLFVHALT